jgi:hypothetical protein
MVFAAGGLQYGFDCRGVTLHAAWNLPHLFQARKLLAENGERAMQLIERRREFGLAIPSHPLTSFLNTWMMASCS